MGIKAKVMTQFGEKRECYIRLNNVETSNHGVKSYALFRAFLSKDAFETGSHYVSEYSVEFDADVSAPIWPQAYAALVDQEGLAASEV